MQGQMSRPTDPTHIAHAGTPNEVWWSPAAQAWVPAAVKAPDLSRLVSAYTALGDARTVRRRAYEKDDLELEEGQKKLKALMLQTLNDNGAKSIATDAGTAYRTEKIKPSAADWSAIHTWIMEDPERFELLERRLKSTFISDFMEANDGAIPPGINVHREYEVSVRRPNASTKPNKSTNEERP